VLLRVSHLKNRQLKSLQKNPMLPQKMMAKCKLLLQWFQYQQVSLLELSADKQAQPKVKDVHTRKVIKLKSLEDKHLQKHNQWLWV
jgi:hypothetical protein